MSKIYLDNKIQAMIGLSDKIFEAMYTTHMIKYMKNKMEYLIISYKHNSLNIIIILTPTYNPCLFGLITYFTNLMKDLKNNMNS